MSPFPLSSPEVFFINPVYKDDRPRSTPDPSLTLRILVRIYQTYPPTNGPSVDQGPYPQSLSSLTDELEGDKDTWETF